MTPPRLVSKLDSKIDPETQREAFQGRWSRWKEVAATAIQCARAAEQDRDEAWARAKALQHAADEMAGSLGCRCVKGWGTNEPRPVTYSVCAPCRYRAVRDERG